MERKRRSFADGMAIAETLQVGRAEIMREVHANIARECGISVINAGQLAENVQQRR